MVGKAPGGVLGEGGGRGHGGRWRAHDAERERHAGVKRVGGTHQRWARGGGGWEGVGRAPVGSWVRGGLGVTGVAGGRTTPIVSGPWVGKGWVEDGAENKARTRSLNLPLAFSIGLFFLTPPTRLPPGGTRVCG